MISFARTPRKIKKMFTDGYPKTTPAMRRLTHRYLRFAAKHGHTVWVENHG